MTEDYSVIGKPSIRKTAHRIVTGKHEFASDVQLPEMLHGRILGCPYPHARIKGIDTRKAEALPRVKAVADFRDGVGGGCLENPYPAFQEEAYWAGQEVAAVAAVDLHTADEALDLMEIEWEELPFYLDPMEAMKPGATQTTIAPGNILLGGPLEATRGDLDVGLVEADVIVEDDVGWTAHFQHSPAEPRSSVAKWDGDLLTVWASSQDTFGQRAGIAQAFNVPQSKVRVISHASGGGFGDKHFADASSCLAAAILAKKAGKPVKVHLTRRDNFVMAHHQFPIRAHMEVGAKNDGTLTAIEYSCIVDVNAGWHALGVDAFSPPRVTWTCPNAKFTAYNVMTNKPINLFYRCVGEPSGTFAMMIVIQQLCEKLGMDPLDFALKNVRKQGDEDQDSGLPISSIGIEECLAKGADKFGWMEKHHMPGENTLLDGRKHGVGLALLCSNKGAMSPPMSATVYITGDGKALFVTGSTENHPSPHAMCMIAAEELGLPLADVEQWEWSDTAISQDTGSQGGSRMTTSGGSAAKEAAVDAKQQLFEVAAEILKVPPEDLEARDGKIYVKREPEKVLTHHEVAAASPKPIIGRGVYDRPPGWDMKTWAAHFAEVAVDTETGDIEILSYVAAHDVGRVIFLEGCENQVLGALQALSNGLWDEQIYDPDTGATLNPNLYETRMMTSLDAPKIDTILVESVDAIGPFGAKGIGEPPVAPPQAALANAIYNAIGVWVKEHPITPQKILTALGKA